jgi:hypothetical protein
MKRSEIRDRPNQTPALAPADAKLRPPILRDIFAIMPKTKASRSHATVRKSTARPNGVPKIYARIRPALERDHFGDYVMINTDTSEYVLAPTTSEVQAAFIEKFGEDAPGWCTRIGISVFATI